MVGGGQRVAVGAEGHGVDAFRMAGQAEQFLAR